jgi:membrane fusion protein (multidrug efflux system)
MQKKKRTVLIIIVLLLIILIVAAYLRIKQNASEISHRPPTMTNVVAGKASRGEITKVETLTGDILPVQQANIYSKVNGNIEKIYVDIGDYVRTGQVLALIDTTIYSQNMKQANANYSQTQANLENAKLNYDRNSSLFSQNLISKQDADNSKTAYDVALSQKDAAYANYKNAMTQLGYCKITAPFTGYITKRFFDAGAYVSSSVNTSSSVIFTLMDLDRLKAIINLPEKDVEFLSHIIDIQVVADALPGMSFSATLKKISGAVDVSTRTMQVEIDIENTNKQLKPGMFANINLILAKKTNTLIMPNEVVLNDNDGNYVFVVNTDSTVHKRYVQIGIQQNNKDEILSGISDNERIVFSGQTLVKNRAKVRIIK